MAHDSSAGSRPRVLLVEDHVDTRSMYMEFLGTDFDISEAGDGLSALQAVEERMPDVIVTDLALPRMDGFELIARLRADPRFAAIPVIALSGYSGVEYDQRVKQLRPVTVLQKPCLPDALVIEVEKHLRGKTGSER
jgi:CheY-like chemotaxis protein